MQPQLSHFGVKGMKWGHRKAAQAKEAAYRKKMTAILKTNKNIPASDERLLKYRNQSVIRRVGGVAARTAVGHVLGAVITEKLTGKKPDYKELSKKIAMDTAKQVALAEAMSTTVSKRYNSDGKRISGKANALMQPEEVAGIAIALAPAAAQLTGIGVGMGLGAMRANRRKNEEVFNKWGGNILMEKGTSEVLWRSADDSVRIHKN